MTNSGETSGQVITVHLVDPNQGHSVQSWSVPAKAVITIGRADDRDVVIVDPYVSRNHAELHLRDGEWWLVSKGRHGVLLDGRSVSDAPLEDGEVFQLGPAGPTLKFQDHPQEHRGSATLDFDAEEIVVLRMNKAAVRDEVSEIAAGEYFQNLQQRARQLRDERSSDATARRRT